MGPGSKCLHTHTPQLLYELSSFNCGDHLLMTGFSCRNTPSRMEGDPLARITPWRSEGEGDSQDGTPVHNSNPAINMPSSGADTSAGAAGREGAQEPSQASADWGDMGDFSMAPLEAPAFSGAEEGQQPEQHQQHSHTTRYKTASRLCLPVTCWKAV